MLYLLCFFGFDVLYLLAGSIYMMYHMHLGGVDWDNIIWLLWPIMLWHDWRFHSFVKKQNKKWG